VREELGVPQKDLLVYVGGGAALGPLNMKSAAAALRPGNMRVVVSSNVSWPGSLHIPQNDPESQDYVGACDLVVCKAGYSTISEAISARVPMLLFHNFIEGEWLTREVRTLGLGEEITHSAFVGAGWATRLEALDRWKAAYEDLPGRLTRDGAAEAVEEVLNVIGG
jgi:predicted glycosyltransferase